MNKWHDQCSENNGCKHLCSCSNGVIKKNLAIKEMPGSFSNDNDFRYVTRSFIRYLATLRLPFFQIQILFLWFFTSQVQSKTLIKKWCYTVECTKNWVTNIYVTRGCRNIPATCFLPRQKYGCSKESYVKQRIEVGPKFRRYIGREISVILHS